MSNDSRLVMNQGPQPGQTFMIDKDLVTLGRDPSSELVINDPQASRQHARITRRGNLEVIEDLGSTNGTFVNGVRLTDPHTLTNGDVIGLGDSIRLTYYGSGASMMAPTEGRCDRVTRRRRPPHPRRQPIRLHRQPIPRHLRRAHRRFTQAHRSKKRKNPSYGLGAGAWCSY
ncbi:MAG: hypothetical protein B6I34_08780 [Anaerolineaceae bacterium 4572_32.1]|nr:MAG: hypothetical protein B6I34_08780 [Anaerolineaceae bacterium 4572_32.1]